MSRKSRNTAVLKESANVKLSVAVYVRLSVVKENHLGDSVQNQTNIIKEYIDNHDNMKLFKLYIDENASGSNFNRNGFNKMLKDIENSKINCVIVKDLSRLGRDLISVGYYVQQLFPSKKIRFISIGDNFDTLDGITNIDDPTKPITRIPVTALADEYYSKDVSQKVQMTIDSNIKDGKFVAPRAPFGYMKSKTDSHKLVIDEDAAFIVREIFKLAYNRSSLIEIVRQLNRQQYLTPINYAISTGLKGNYDSGNGLWNTRTVKNILTNRVYVGDLEQGKNKNLVMNTHEPIISREIYESVNNTLNHNVESYVKAQLPSPAADNIFRGKVICGGMYIKESNVNDSVNNAIKDFIINHQNTYQALVNRQKDIVQKLKHINNQFVLANDVKANYEAFISGEISENEYKSIRTKKDTFKNEISSLEAELVKLEEKINIYDGFKSSSYENIVNLYIDKIVGFSSKELKVIFLKNIL